ncbi:MAG TPA: alpha/beta hydrolase [Xanthobacteraceae bacterium]|nr:alpha/beta hydrolase [Xanthobacteraceae bacterium]
MPIARRAALAAAFAVFVLAPFARAQIAPPRTVEELKAETQARADRNAYPLIGIKPADARAALAEIKTLDRDEWAAAWSRVAARYETDAKAAEAAGRIDEAKAGYLMAWRLYSFARWPTPNSPGKQTAYAQALEAFAHYARLLDPAPTLVRIPFEGKEIVGWLRLPKGGHAGAPAPLVLTISALDSRKEDNVERSEAFIRRGIATFSLDMPGTGQAPFKGDIGSERMFSRALDYVATRPEIDAKRVVVQGVSWSGYWSAKLAIVERERLRGAVVQGGPIHYYFQPEWQTKALGTREYLFDLFPARASVYGVATLDEFLAYGPRMSLKAQALIDNPSAPMLLVNGEHDSQVPIADLDLMLHAGSAKEAWVNPAGAHTGRSADWPDGKIFAKVVAPWIARQLGLGE